MKRSLKRILPILLAIVIICSLVWYLFVYDRDFTRDMLMDQARFFEERGNTSVAAWMYHLAYDQSNGDEDVAIELARHFKENGNYTQAEVTLSKAISDGGSAQLYIELCKTYVEQDKLLDAVTMLEHITNEAIRAELESQRPAAPTATPEPNYFNQYINVTVTAPDGKLYMTTNGEYPSTENGVSSGELTLESGETVIYALSVGDNGLVSPLAVLGYTVSGVVEDVTLADSNIDAAVRKALAIQGNDPISTSDLWTVTSLSLPDGAESYLDIAYMPYLESLTISGSTADSLEGLGALTALTELSITDSLLSGADLAIIASLPNLQQLTLSNCGLSSIDNLAGAKNLTYLDLSNNSIRDFTAISFTTGLLYLDLSHNALTSLNALSALTALQTLDVSYNSLTSVSPAAVCTQLQVLNVSNNSLETLSGLAGMSVLAELNAGYNDLTDVTAISSCADLKSLDISGNKLTDISSLGALSGLQYFYFSRNEIAALPTFTDGCSLVTVDGSYNALTSVQTLEGLDTLNNVLMDYNDITNVDCLAKCHNLIKVSIYGNPVSDVSKLTEQSIIVNYNPLAG